MSRPAFTRIEAERRAVRLVGMRGSAFLVPVQRADDVVAAFRQDPVRRPGDLRARGLDAATYVALRPRILDVATEPITPTQLRLALGATREDERPYFAMRLMAREGLVLRVGAGRVRTDDVRWVATEAWVGRRLGNADPVEALGRLAGGYLRAYGPARVEDFAWWAGVPMRAAARALAATAVADVGGGYLLQPDLVAAWESVRPVDAGAIDVLPKWDPYTMGYAPDGRDRLVRPEHRALAYSTAATRVGATSGDGLPLVLRAGRAVARWDHRLAGAAMDVSIAVFGDTADGRDLLTAARPAFDEIDELFEADVKLRLATA